MDSLDQRLKMARASGPKWLKATPVTIRYQVSIYWLRT